MKNVYFNHDGNVDDLVSLLLLLQVSDIKLIGVSVIDADCYIDPATRASRKIIDRFNTNNDYLEVAKSNSRAHHPFPSNWRLSSFSFNAFPMLNESGIILTKEAKEPAHIDMVKKIEKADGPVDLIMTGPLTDLARALDYDQSIENKIERLYWMGGSLDGHGNVNELGFDGTAEWNAFWDPEAVKRVFASKLDIQMVGLESTEEIPLTRELRLHWASLRKFPAIDLIGQGYSLVLADEADSTYYLWDVLTTLSSLYPDLIETEDVKASVETSGVAAGRTYRNDNGRPLSLVTKTNKKEFFKLMDNLGKTALLR
ncbi:ABC transporter substrate-binding protein [Lactobacillus sp. 0.1XD8-4]|uniref:nucleoside hydrolase n=1 Tax=uncultured Limosilactobacillus sp. TaxID=2837629 RepID=UPI00129ED6E7|nr:nucleoside hydrolase [uncultured Limosilactobacillus sp.]MRN06796.1 ABC transporter substrate-binding protein [Lactobacillus sp. 0.1XD8-4]